MSGEHQKVLRRLIDYYRRDKLIEELKSKPVKQINWFKIVLIELKQTLNNTWSINRRLLGLETGEMFRTMYVLPTHRDVRYYFEKDGQKLRQFHKFHLFDYIDNPVIKYAIKRTIKNVYEWNGETDEDTIKKIKDILKLKIVSYSYETYEDKLFNLLQQEKWTKKEFKNLPELTQQIRQFMIKKRFKIGSMDLKKTPRSYYSPLNLKHWDKKSKKTSNKGLKANTTYSWTDEETKRRGGWTFGGITVDCLIRICQDNGFNEPKKNINGKKINYQYGDYAEWLLYRLE